MKAVVYKDKNEVSVDKVDDPKIKNPKDAILRITSTAICGSDLHMYDGRTGIEKGSIFGHEIMGVIKEVGDAVNSIKVGDRVVLPFNISCGYCENCIRGYTSACLAANPDKAGAAYGYAEMGPYEGGQAELVLVPNADFNCIKLPGKEGDEFEDDFLMLSDIFPTGYHGTELAMVEPGSTVAIYGAGPVGLLAAHSAMIKGASEVYVIDRSETRLALAKKMGATPINFTAGKPSEQIKKIRMKNKLLLDSLRPGEEKMMGVMCAVDAVGFQAHSFENPDQEDPTAVINDMIEVVNPTGHLGVVGVFPSQDPGGTNDLHKKGTYEVPWGKIFDKGLTVGMGQTPVRKYSEHLKKLIIQGKAKPSVIISHRVKIDEAPQAYKQFDLRGVSSGAEYTKIVLKP